GYSRAQARFRRARARTWASAARGLPAFAHGLGLAMQPSLDRRENELADIAAQHGDLAHDGARDELVLVRGRHEQRLDLGQQVTVHARHLEFVLEIRYRTQPAHDNAAVLLANEVLEQAGKAVDLDIGIVAQYLAGDFDALFDGKERLLVLAVGHADHDTVKEAGGPSHEILVASGQWVKGARIDGSDHGVSVS